MGGTQRVDSIQRVVLYVGNSIVVFRMEEDFGGKVVVIEEKLDSSYRAHKPGKCHNTVGAVT